MKNTNDYKSRLKKKTVKQIIFLTLPLLLIAVAYAIFISSADLDGKLIRTEEEIYSQIYSVETVD